MVERSDLPWEKIYDYVVACGGHRDPVEFVHAMLDEMDDLVPFDEGVAFCLDESRRVCDQWLVNIKPRWLNMYLDYYSHIQGTQWNLRTSPANELRKKPTVEHIQWGDAPMDEFVANYIMARGIQCSLAVTFFDPNGLPRVVLSFDRVRRSRFTAREVETVRYASIQLGMLFKNFLVNPSLFPSAIAQNVGIDSRIEKVLTKRELEVVELLARGLSPAHVATTLHISISTAYKHIAHIYKKLNVSSQQELLVRVLGSR